MKGSLFASVLLLTGGYVVMPEKLVPVHVFPEQKTIEQLVQEVPGKYGLPVELVEAVVERESNGRNASLRFEPSQEARAKKAAKSSHPDVWRGYAASHCAMQVMGWWSPEFGLKDWSELYDPETCVEVGSAILKKCLDRAKGPRKIDRYYQTLVCYNGKETYAKEVLNKLGARLIEKL